MNTSHALHEKFADKKSDNEQLSSDGSLDFQSASPGDCQHKVLHTIRTTEKGMCSNIYTSKIFLLSLTVICPIAIAYSMGQIIHLVGLLSVHVSDCLSALSLSHFLIDFRQM